VKILFQSNAPWVKSGYGVSCEYLTKIWRQLGHEIGIFAYFGLEGSMTEYDGMPVYPKAMDVWGNDIVEAHAKEFGAHLVVTNVDCWVLHEYGKKDFNWLPLAPVAEDPLTPGYKGSLQGADKICAISAYGKRVLEDGGFPADHIYLPVPTQFFRPLDRGKIRSGHQLPDDAYIFGHIGMNRGPRKGMDLLLQAFQYVIAEYPKSILIMHTDPHSHDGINLNSLIDSLGIRDNMRMTSRYEAVHGMPTRSILSFLNAIDCYVQPALNEGQAVPVWEAMSCGKPIVATDATALSEAIEDADALALTPVNKIWLPSEGYGYEPSIEDIADKMIQAIRQWGPGFVSVKNRQKAVENVSPEAIAHQWQPLLIDLEKKIRFQPTYRPWTEKPTVVQLSTTERNCGIGLYTRALQASLEGATNQLYADIRAVRSAEQIPDCDLLHLHYEPAITPPRNTLYDILNDIRQRGTKTIMTCHAVIPEVVDELLRKNLIHHAIVHWLPPGITFSDPRITVMGGMGCPQYDPQRAIHKLSVREKYGFPPGAQIISTFGFASGGRGHFEVLEQLAPRLQQHSHIMMQLILPANFLNQEGKDYVHQEIQRVAAEYHIGRQIHLVAEFLPPLDVMNRLWLSDLGFLYIGQDTYSSSAAIRQFISARLPLVVNSSSHFADVRRGVVRVDSFHLAEFSDAVWDTLQDAELCQKLSLEHARTYEQYVWPIFGERHLNIYRKLVGGKKIIMDKGSGEFEVIDRTAIQGEQHG
jgi:glycosyltransferase involved in cell wall biosynthesis